MTNDRVLDNRTVYVFNKKGGKVIKSASGMGKGMVGYWALQNTTKSRFSVLVFTDTNEIERAYVGTENGFPKVIHVEDMGLSLDDYIADEQHLDTQALINDLERLGS